MIGPFSVHVGSSINVGPFVVLEADGVTVDTETTITVVSSNTNVNVGVLSSDNRSVFIDGLSPTGGANVIVSATEDGKQLSDSFLVEVLVAPNDAAISDSTVTATAEYATPTTR